MINILESIFSFVQSFVQFFIDLFGNLIKAWGYLNQGMAILYNLVVFLPGPILIFAAAYLAVYVINRLSMGSNGGS